MVTVLVPSGSSFSMLLLPEVILVEENRVVLFQWIQFYHRVGALIDTETMISGVDRHIFIDAIRDDLSPPCIATLVGIYSFQKRSPNDGTTSTISGDISLILRKLVSL